MHRNKFPSLIWKVFFSILGGIYIASLQSLRSLGIDISPSTEKLDFSNFVKIIRTSFIISFKIFLQKDVGYGWRKSITKFRYYNVEMMLDAIWIFLFVASVCFSTTPPRLFDLISGSLATQLGFFNCCWNEHIFTCTFSSHITWAKCTDLQIWSCSHASMQKIVFFRGDPWDLWMLIVAY